MDHWSDKVPRGPKARRAESRGPPKSRRSADYNDGYDSYTPSSKTWKNPALDERPKTPQRRDTDDDPWSTKKSPKEAARRKQPAWGGEEGSPESPERTRRSSDSRPSTSGSITRRAREESRPPIHRRGGSTGNGTSANSMDIDPAKRKLPLWVETEPKKARVEQETITFLTRTPTSAIPHIHPSRRESIAMSNFSGNGTPRTTTTAMDLDQPPPAMFSYDDAPADYPSFTYPKTNGVVVSSNWKMVAKHLDNFAKAVDEYYKYSSTRATVQAKIEKLETEYKKWADQRGDFQSLAEEQAKDLKKLKDHATRLDEKLEVLRIDRDEKNKTLSMNIAGLVNPESASGIKKVDTKVQTLEEEIKQLKASHEKDLTDLKKSIAAMSSSVATAKEAEVKELKANIAAVTASVASIKEAEIKELKAMLAAAASSAAATKSDKRSYGSDDIKIEKLTADVTENQRALQKLRLEVGGPGGTVPKLESRVSALEKTGVDRSSDSRKFEGPQKKYAEIHDLEDLRKQLASGLSLQTELGAVVNKVALMSEKLESATTTRTELDGVRERFDSELSGVRDKVDSLYSAMQSLKDDLERVRTNSNADDIQSRLSAIPDDIQSRLNAIPDDLQNRLSAILERISDIKDDQDSLSDRLTLHGSRLASLASAQTSNVTRSELENSIERAVQESAGVAAEFTQLRSEQEVKDDLVGQEVERLDRELSAAKVSIEQLLSTVKDMSRDAIAKRAETEDTSKSTAVTVTNDVKSVQNAKQLGELNTRIIVCESSLKGLQQRFDNLSTADLAKNMVHQMASMYSYPANVLTQLDQLSRNYTAMVHNITNNKNRMEAEFAKLSQVLNLPADIANQRAMLGDHAEKINSLKDRQLATISEQVEKINSLEEQLLGFSAQFSDLTNTPGKIKALEDQLAVVSKDCKELTRNPNPEDISTKLSNATSQFSLAITTVKTEMKAISDTLATKAALTEYKTLKSVSGKGITEVKNRLEEMENTLLQEYASLHARVDINERRVTRLMEHFGISEDGTGNEIGDDRSDPGRQLGATPNMTLTLDDEDEEDNEDDGDGNKVGKETENEGDSDSESESIIEGRSASLKRKRASKGQSSNKSDGSDSDVNPRRRARATD